MRRAIYEDDVIRLLDKGWKSGVYPVASNIHALPSAQPEIIRCKDCIHRDPEDKKCDSGHAILWQLPRDDYWYCADAERREE